MIKSLNYTYYFFFSLCIVHTDASLSSFNFTFFADPAEEETHYERDFTHNRVTENRAFDDDFLLCKEEIQDKRHYQELLSGVSEKSPDVVNDDLEVSDSDDETKEHNIDVPQKVMQSSVVENEDDDPEGLWF